MAKQSVKAAKGAGRVARGAGKKSAAAPGGRSRTGGAPGRARGKGRSRGGPRDRTGRRRATPAASRPAERRTRTLALAGLPLRSRFDEEPETHATSATAVAAEALRTGIVPNAAPGRDGGRAVPGEGRKMLVGDPDDDSLRNEYTGEETPGGSTPTPDQNDVDEIGLAYGVKEEDSGELRTSAEVLDRRDRRRRGLAPGRHRA
jgi:hypothetical protein